MISYVLCKVVGTDQVSSKLSELKTKLFGTKFACFLTMTIVQDFSYPTDTDKLMLAKQTGLSRNQVRYSFPPLSHSLRCFMLESSDQFSPCPSLNTRTSL